MIERLSGEKVERPLSPGYKMVDTCAAEFEAQTPYFYASCDQEDEASAFLAARRSEKKTVLVLGSARFASARA